MRRVPKQFTSGGDRDNAQKAWLDGYDTARRDIEAQRQTEPLTCRYGHGVYCQICAMGTQHPYEDTGR